MDEITLLTVKMHIADVKTKILEIGLMTDDEKATKIDFWNAVVDLVNSIEELEELFRLEKR